MTRSVGRILCIAGLAALTLSPSLLAEEAVWLDETKLGRAFTGGNWRPEDFTNAIPLDLLTYDPTESNGDVESRVAEENPDRIYSEPKPPTLDLDLSEGSTPKPAVRNDNDTDTPADEEDRPVETTSRDLGTGGIPYTSQWQRLPKFWPNSTIGKLFFRDDDRVYTCTASVIDRRILLTAGHCLHRGSGGNNGWYRDFVFKASYKNGIARNGTWTSSRAVVPQQWFGGGGEVLSAHDYGLLVLDDKLLDGAMVPIGGVTGALGWVTNNLDNNHVHVVGYPGNKADGELPHQVSTVTGYLNGTHWEIGNDQGPGVSGAPLIQNFGIALDGTVPTPGPDGLRLSVVGVLIAGPQDPSLRLAAAVQLTNSFSSLLDSACAQGDGNNCY